MAPHSSTLAWKIPWTEEPGWLQSMGSWRVGHDWLTSLSLFTFMHWRRKWQPTPVFLPGESQGQGSLVGCHLWGHTESYTTEATWQQQHEGTEVGTNNLATMGVQSVYLAFIFWRITCIFSKWQWETFDKNALLIKCLLIIWNFLSNFNEIFIVYWLVMSSGLTLGSLNISQSFLHGFDVSRLGSHLCFHFIWRKLSPQEVTFFVVNSVCCLSENKWYC